MSPTTTVAQEPGIVDVARDVEDDLPPDSLDAFNDTWTAPPNASVTPEMSTVSGS